MDAKQELAIQQQIVEYFKDYDDKTLVAVIESFNYQRPAASTEISELIEKFIDDNGIKTALMTMVLRQHS